MKYPPLPPRKKNRLQGYNYSRPGWYFLTVCVKNRVPCLGFIQNKSMYLNTHGRIVQKQWQWLQDRYDFVTLDAFVIMPNHVHGIVVIGEDNGGDNLGRDNSRVVSTANRRHNLLSKTMNAFKTTSSKMIHRNGYPEFTWQRSSYDHIIRNENALHNIREYIRNNPAKYLHKY